MNEMPNDARPFQFSLKSMFAIIAIVAVMAFAFRHGSPASFLLLFATTILTIAITSSRAVKLRKSSRVFCACYALICTIGVIVTCSARTSFPDVNILRSMLWGLSYGEDWFGNWFSFFGSAMLGNMYLIATITSSVALSGTATACYVLWQRFRKRKSARSELR